MTITAKSAGRTALLALLARWTWLLLAHPMRQDVIGGTLLHAISIPFHEAGHILLSPFGELMTTLGGSVMQVLVPVVCAYAFLTTSLDPFAAAVCAWWAGENLLDVALYINDARALNLVLIGGATGAEVEGHDWERILQMTGALARDHQLAWTTHAIGAVVMLTALVVAAVIVFRDRRA